MSRIHVPFGTTAAGAVGVVLCIAPCASAAVVGFTDLAAFNAAAGSPPITINFDNIAPGTDIGNTTIAGVQFLQSGSPLQVVAAADTFTPAGVFSSTPDPSVNKLPATSGANVLSPGGAQLGSGAQFDQDGVELRFAAPVSAFGFDLLSQSRDGFSFSGIQVLDSNGGTLLNTGIPIGSNPGAAGGSDFFGVVSDASDISRILLTEGDGDTTNPDANVGYDTFRFTAPVPEPAVGGVGLTALALMLRRRQKRVQR
jgi:hypothetical protein